MLEIEKPKIETEELNDRYGRFVVEPLERGYGITLGNSMRRILLSSLPGAAVTSIKIEGVLHEFSTVPGVVEDVTEIILNIKNLTLKLHGDEEQVLRIEAEGEGVITAKDIIAPPEVEILNPDLVIAHIAEGGRLFMEMTVARGRGYVPAERNKKGEHVIGVIPVDSIFSPVLKVNFQVENTRVGQITDYDKLTLEVWTDGSIRPDEAVSLAARIMVEHLQLFVNLNERATGVEIMVEKEEDAKEKLAEMPIEDLDLSVRSYNCLKRAGINTVGELIQKTEADMMKVRNLGKKSLEEVISKLNSMGLSLRKEEE
ncbi:DNA-directed RNA polymerase subunit alpha [Carboxydothermus ferrireducens]|uniref:DNA-directed RNA polymerase subunit alpha n=1 Tax=Carboxydothermus ferrireducens DSM 11255 TaxID=1119529 RepID=A0ABX2RAK8_9THEO|nr:DNA-directed RNA polymerase subunit alpha [Carboxydothermus ferrireducens]NYE57969.1 DNA-directed RNA polymerase subunit alpha [Carboxydothermus ferrireducens DSM 11255]